MWREREQACVVGGRDWKERERVVGGRDVVDERERGSERAREGEGDARAVRTHTEEVECV